MIRVTMKEFATAVETYTLNMAEPVDYKKMKVTKTLVEDDDEDLILLKPEDIVLPEEFK